MVTNNGLRMSLVIFCQCACRHSYGLNFCSIFMKFCTVVRGLKGKIEFVWGENQMISSTILPKVSNPGTIFQSRDFGIGKRQSRDPGINPGIAS